MHRLNTVRVVNSNSPSFPYIFEIFLMEPMTAVSTIPRMPFPELSECFNAAVTLATTMTTAIYAGILQLTNNMSSNLP